MTNPEAEERLEKIGDEAFLAWKALVHAINAFYADDRPALEKAIQDIAPKSPPSVLIPLFDAWSGKTEPDGGSPLGNAGRVVIELYKRVIFAVHPVKLLADQADEALRQGMIDHFELMASRVLRELHELKTPEAATLAIRYAQRCLSLLDETGEESIDFFSVIVRSLGRKDGLIALAFALVGRDDQAAASAFSGAVQAEGPTRFLDSQTREIAVLASEILTENARSRKEPIPLPTASTHAGSVYGATTFGVPASAEVAASLFTASTAAKTVPVQATPTRSRSSGKAPCAGQLDLFVQEST
jgi:hypothetical protein